MVRTLLGVVLSGTVLLGWCWYYSDYLPHHADQLSKMMQEEPEPAEQAAAGNVENTAKEEGEEVTFVQGPLAFSLFEANAEGARDYRKIGLGLATFVGVALVASLLLAMARLRGYFARVGFVTVLGAFAAVLLTCDALFWGQTWELTAYKSMFFVSGALITGLVLAAFVRPQPTPVKVPVRVR